MATRDYDLVIVGAGSGNSLPIEQFRGWRIAIVEADKFGGTCLNRGCIPSKMLVGTADVAATVRDAHRFGIDARFTGADWPAIRDRVFARIDESPGQAVASRRDEGVDVYLGEASFTGPRVLRVGDDELRADKIVLANGGRVQVPDIDGLAQVDYLTSDTVMRVEALPASMIVLGGGYIAAEMSHVFGSLGTRITIIEVDSLLLARYDTDIRERFTEITGERFTLLLDSTTKKVTAGGPGVVLDVTTPDGPRQIEAERLLVATGRQPNSDRLNLDAAGIEVDEHGHIRTDDTLRTTAAGVWALGDVENHFQLKHMANAQARIVWHNVAHPGQPRNSTFRVVPSAVFSHPQVAAVGATEDELKEAGRPYRTVTRPLSAIAYGWALQDTTGFAKILADPDTGLLLGAHIIGPEAPILIQPLLQAICLGNTVSEVATGVLYIHPAMTELIEQVLLELDQ